VAAVSSSATHDAGYMSADTIAWEEDLQQGCQLSVGVVVEASAQCCYDLWNDWQRLVDFIDLIAQVHNSAGPSARPPHCGERADCLRAFRSASTLTTLTWPCSSASTDGVCSALPAGQLALCLPGVSSSPRVHAGKMPTLEVVCALQKVANDTEHTIAFESVYGAPMKGVGGHQRCCRIRCTCVLMVMLVVLLHSSLESCEMSSDTCHPIHQRDTDTTTRALCADNHTCT
jgi:hypothetical protein